MGNVYKNCFWDLFFEERDLFSILVVPAVFGGLEDWLSRLVDDWMAFFVAYLPNGLVEHWLAIGIQALTAFRIEDWGWGELNDSGGPGIVGFVLLALGGELRRGVDGRDRCCDWCGINLWGVLLL